MLERYLHARQLSSEWFQNLDIYDQEIEALIDNGYIFPLLERDQYGRQVILINTARADPYRFGSKEIIRAYSILGELLMDIEENQVRGYTYVHILTGATIAHGTVWSLSDMRNFFKWMKNVSPIRNKQINIVSVPNHIRKVLDFIINNNVCK
ncbi:GSCOCG00002410001-RA-CDS [Cotesia congregata]|nr:GSCOCG00002410001-RA-CDS [Cotesia congregata]